jgi:putative heme-binding domain-containing protein
VREKLLADSDAALRLAALLAFRRAGPPTEPLLRTTLADADEAVRRLALQWAGEAEFRAVSAAVDAAIARPDLSAPLFATWLATREILDAPPPAPGAPRPRGFAIKREPDARLLARVLGDGARSVPVRLLALRALGGLAPALAAETALPLARAADRALRIEAIRALGAHDTPAGRATLIALASTATEPPALRAEAVAALSAGAADVLSPLLDDPAPAVRTQAARTLRRLPPPAAPPPAPNATAEWLRLLATGGDAAAGARVFFATTSTCVSCHRVDGRGGAVGPDLSVLARTATREQIVRSLIEPSAEIAPQFQGWEVKTKKGEVFTGLQGHWRNAGAATLILHDGREAKWGPGEVVSLRAMTESMMPEGLAALLSVEELRDLVAWLAERR